MGAWQCRCGRSIRSSTEPASLAEPALRIKYRFDSSEPTRRFRTLISRLREQTRASWSDAASEDDPELSEIEDAIFELSRLMAGLTATDGAAVFDKRFELLGFGAEVVISHDGAVRFVAQREGDVVFWEQSVSP